jgi:hypothetical protein
MDIFEAPALRWLTRIISASGYCNALSDYHAEGCAAMPETSIWAWNIGGAGGLWPGAPAGSATAAPAPGLVREALQTSVKTGAPLPAARLNALRTALSVDWPDLIFVRSDLAELAPETDAAGFQQTLINLYHVLEPGGSLFIAEASQSPAAANAVRLFAENQEADISTSRDGVVEFRKEANIYCASSIPLADRSSIYEPASCEAAVDAMFSGSSLRGGRLLDVGVGDGRFSRSVLTWCERLGVEYVGTEMASKPALMSNAARVAAHTRYGTNFFCMSEREEYDAILLFFVFHSTKHWPLFLFHASRMLRPGGVVFLSNRTDPFIRWTHGDFEGSEPERAQAPLLYDETRSYWTMREERGIRRFGQIATASNPDYCLNAASRLGFHLEARFVAEREREYLLHRRQLCPDQDGPAMWNVGRVGLTRSDRQALANSIRMETISATLPENTVISVLRKISA